MTFAGELWCETEHLIVARFEVDDDTCVKLVNAECKQADMLLSDNAALNSHRERDVAWDTPSDRLTPTPEAIGSAA